MVSISLPGFSISSGSVVTPSVKVVEQFIALTNSVGLALAKFIRNNFTGYVRHLFRIIQCFAIRDSKAPRQIRHKDHLPPHAKLIEALCRAHQIDKFCTITLYVRAFPFQGPGKHIIIRRVAAVGRAGQQ